MRGKLPIEWIWNWLGQGSLGEEYDVVPVVQPTVEVFPWNMPQDLGLFFQTQPQVAGTLTTVLPLPVDQKMARIWWQLSYYRSVAAAGDGTQVRHLVNGQWRQILYSLVDPLIVANGPIPVIGSRLSVPIPAGSIATLTGGPPILASYRSNIQIDSVSAAAAGNFILEGLYTDISAYAPVPWEFW